MVIKVLFIGICIGITMRQGYNTANKFNKSPISTQVLEIPLQGKWTNIFALKLNFANYWNNSLFAAK